MAICNVKHPIKDTVKADNSTYSSNKIESLIHSATELPETGIEDAGDVLMVNDEGEWAKGEIIIPQEVPTPSLADTGKFIGVNVAGEYILKHALRAPSGVIKNGVTVNPINLDVQIQSFNPNECALILVEMETYTAIYFKMAYKAPSPDNKIVFSAIVSTSSKIYYYEIKIAPNATSIPAGTIITKTEIG